MKKIRFFVILLIVSFGLQSMQAEGFTRNRMRKNAVKFDFFSPLLGYANFSYERNLLPGQNLELGIGAIGLGKDLFERDAIGGVFSAGYRFYNGRHNSSAFSGAYVKPTIDLVGYNFTDGEKKRQLSMALMVKGGRQWVFADAFLIDVYGGAGYGFSSADSEFYNYLYWGGTPATVGFVVTVGFSIGFAF